jgi:hypothetical protein
MTLSQEQLLDPHRVIMHLSCALESGKLLRPALASLDRGGIPGSCPVQYF